LPQSALDCDLNDGISSLVMNEAPETIARRAMRRCQRASLATFYADKNAMWPYVSLALVACDIDLSPLLFISDLAVHTRNIVCDPRASLLFDLTAEVADPLSGTRVTVLGTLVPLADERALDRYLMYHADAAAFREFGDFRLWRLEIKRAHLVAGFGRIHWIEASVLCPEASDSTALVEAEPAILAHLNTRHKAMIDLCGLALTGEKDSSWQVIGIDCDGAELRSGSAAARLEFATAARDPQGVLGEFERLLSARDA
jgi:heme iron utilization protein